MAKGRSNPDKGSGSKPERLLPCSLWLEVLMSRDAKTLARVFEDLQMKMDDGMVPGTFAEAIEEGGGGDGMGTHLGVLGRIRKDRLPNGARGLSLPFPVWLALRIGVDDARDLQTRFGKAGGAIKTAFVLSAQRNEGDLVAWRPFLNGVAADLVDEAFAVCAAKGLDERLKAAGSGAAIPPKRTV